MTQSTHWPSSNGEGAVVRGYMDENDKANATCHKGPTAPTYASIAGFLWCDDSADPVWSYKVFEGGDPAVSANWTRLFQINVSTGQFLLQAALKITTASDNQIDINASSGPYSTINFKNADITKAQSFYDNTTSRLYNVVGSNGLYLSSGGTSWTAVSDEREKEIEEPISDARAKLATLRAVIGKYNGEPMGVRRLFLVAQDLLPVFPEAVDATDPDRLGLKYDALIPPLVAAIAETESDLAAIHARLTALEAV